MTTQNIEFTVPVDKITETPLSYNIQATNEEKHVLAERFGLMEVAHLEGDVEVFWRPQEKAVAIKGQLKADITHRCVVSLNPVPEQIETDFEIWLVSEQQADAWDEAEVWYDENHPEYDVLEGDTVAVGDILAQTVPVVMNEYPRADDAEVSVNVKGVSVNEPERTSAFAGLESLRDKS